MIFSPSQCPVIVVYDKEDTNLWIVRELTDAGFPVISFQYGQQFIDAWRENRDGIWTATALILHKDLGDLNNSRAYRDYAYAQSENDFDTVRAMQEEMIAYEKANAVSGRDLASFLQDEANGATYLRLITGSGEYSYTGVRFESIAEFRADAGYDPTEDFLPEWVKSCICLGRVTPVEEVFRGRSLMESEFAVQQRTDWLRGNGLCAVERE